jgi:hypothetical protein
MEEPEGAGAGLWLGGGVRGGGDGGGGVKWGGGRGGGQRNLKRG